MVKDFSLLAPAAVLALWTILVLCYMAVVRFRAMATIGLDLGQAKPGGRGGDLDPVLPPKASWPSHNYTHLLEQPTLFYPVVVILFLVGGTSPLSVGFAWGYTMVRIVHSIWQIAVNRLPIRFMLFMASTICLTALAITAVTITLGFGGALL